jgi:osmotically inducible protein OsmC
VDGFARSASDSVGARLKQRRLALGLRLTDVSAVSGLSEAHISRIESGDRIPSLATFLTMATAYQVDPAQLLPALESSSVARHVGSATWNNAARAASGTLNRGDTSFAYDVDTRLTSSDDWDESERLPRSSPEQLIAMSYSGCFSMSLADTLDRNGFAGAYVETYSEVELTKTGSQVSITGIQVYSVAVQRAISESQFQQLAQQTKGSCVVGRALSAVPIMLHAGLARKKSEVGRTLALLSPAEG